MCPNRWSIRAALLANPDTRVRRSPEKCLKSRLPIRFAWYWYDKNALDQLRNVTKPTIVQPVFYPSSNDLRLVFAGDSRGLACKASSLYTNFGEARHGWLQ